MLISGAPGWEEPELQAEFGADVDRGNGDHIVHAIETECAADFPGGKRGSIRQRAVIGPDGILRVVLGARLLSRAWTGVETPRVLPVPNEYF